MQNQNESVVDNTLQQQTADAPVDYGYLNGSYTMGVDDPQTPDIGVGLIHESTLLLINPTINQPYQHRGGLRIGG